MPRPRIDPRAPGFPVGVGGLVAVTLLGLVGGWPIASAFAALYVAVSAAWGILTTRTWWGPVTRPGAALTSGVAVVVLLVVGTLTSGPQAEGTPDPTDARSTAPATEPTETAAAAPSATASTSVAPSPSAPPPTPTPTPTPDTVDNAADTRTALAAVATLTVKGRAPSTGYDRDLFGPAWADVDLNGCDTRNDVLQRDLVDLEIRPGTGGCTVETGTFHDPYTGATLDFARGWDTSILVQVDHVVALADAWQKGAQQWTPTTRQVFANDPLNLFASDGAANQAKGAGDTATWLPPNKAFRCEYVARQVAVKTLYRLSVTAAERDAMERVLTTCPDEPLPRGGLVQPGTLQPVAGVTADATDSTGSSTGSDRADDAPSSTTGGEPGCPVKGNVAGDGELIYHVPGGQFYAVTNPEQCFDTPADAARAGYRASKR